MKVRTLACLAGSVLAASALAGPDGVACGNHSAPALAPAKAPLLSAGFDSPYSTSFEAPTYTAGQGIVGKDGWALWPGGFDHIVTTAQKNTGAQGLDMSTVFGDVVRNLGNPTTGTWTFSVQTFIPSTSAGDFFMIILNDYDGGGALTNWSVQCSFDAVAGIGANTHPSGAPNGVAAVTNAWAEYVCTIDLDANTVDETYNGQAVSPTFSYAGTAPGGVLQNILASNQSGTLRIHTLDVFNNSSSAAFIDDINFDQGGCYADCDGSGALNIFDYICFGNAYGSQQAYADCDGNGAFNIFDYICFGNAYGAGCP